MKLKKLKAKKQKADNSTKDILNKLLKKTKKIDFRAYIEDSEELKEKIHKKHYIVSVVEILLKTTKKGKFNLCRKHEMIYLYNSQFWENIDTNDFKDFLGKSALKMGVQKFDAKHFSFKDELYKQFISDAGLEEIKTNYDTTLINLLNGTFEITPNKQILRAFKQSDFITYQLPFNYDKKATAPKFKKYLNQVLPEKELQRVLAEYLGYIFIKTKVLKLEKVLLLYGTGANGKSVLFEIMSSLLGTQNISNYSLQSLTNDNGYYRAMISNKLLNYASEINRKLETSTFKLLISGEPVEARLPYGNPQMITDYAKFIFNTNELPKEVENTNAFFRRFIILPFKVTIAEKDQNKELSKKIIDSELSGVFNWVLEGLQRVLINKGFTESNIVKNEVLQFQKESDSVLMFLNEGNYSKSNKCVALKTLYAEYKNYCDDVGAIDVSIKALSKRLKNDKFVFDRKSKGTIVYIGKNK